MSSSIEPGRPAPPDAASPGGRGRLVIISGPSGVGKSTLVPRVMARCRRPLELSVSATTRPPRAGERDGVEYHFLTPQEFAARRQRDEFLESCEVFGRGHWYGTLRSEVEPRLAAGKWVVLEIDVHGAEQVLARVPGAISIFVRPQSLEELERRLRGRGTESEEAIARRLEVARRELSFAERYQHQVVNDQLDRAAEEICELLERAAE
jgi:guanylate kinase